MRLLKNYFNYIDFLVPQYWFNLELATEGDYTKTSLSKRNWQTMLRVLENLRQFFQGRAMIRDGAKDQIYN